MASPPLASNGAYANASAQGVIDYYHGCGPDGPYYDSMFKNILVGGLLPVLIYWSLKDTWKASVWTKWALFLVNGAATVAAIAVLCRSKIWCHEGWPEAWEIIDWLRDVLVALWGLGFACYKVFYQAEKEEKERKKKEEEAALLEEVLAELEKLENTQKRIKAALTGEALAPEVAGNHTTQAEAMPRQQEAVSQDGQRSLRQRRSIVPSRLRFWGDQTNRDMEMARMDRDGRRAVSTSTEA